jgi:hypothetical protein
MLLGFFFGWLPGKPDRIAEYVLLVLLDPIFSSSFLATTFGVIDGLIRQTVLTLSLVRGS